MHFNDKIALDFSELLGRVLKNVCVTDNEVIFTGIDGSQYTLYHSQDCCEHVYVESVVGDVLDLCHTPILLAEESSQDDPDACESGTWTFYKLGTIRGYVDIRFYGSSNGYYSEGVSFAMTLQGCGKYSYW